MSTKNTSNEIPLATREMVGHIQDLLEPTLSALPRNIAQLFIQNGGMVQGKVNPAIAALAEQFRLVSQVARVIKPDPSLTTADDFRRALKAAGCNISDWSDDLFGRPGFTVNPTDEEVELVELTTAQLTGKAEGGTTAEVFAGAARLNLDRCLPDDGPRLRSQYLNQPLGELILMGMEPITDSDGRLRVFSVARIDDGLWLDTRLANPARVWDPGSRWFFRRRKSK